MARLTATFTVPLGATILLRGDQKPRKYSNVIDGFDVGLTIVPFEGARSKIRNERLWTYLCEQVSVSIARDELLPPPEVQSVPGGGRDFTVRAPYFEQRLPEYRRVASQALSNAISFLRFELRQPLLRGLSHSSQHLANPEWTDDRGKRIDPGIATFVVRAISGERREFGVVKLERKHDKLLRAALAKPKLPSLPVEILSDAQASAFDGNIRRAVLELAIACEVFAKHTFLGSAGGAAQVYAALEDKGKVAVRVLDLIDIGGSALLGKSFRSVDKGAHTDIDHLFRARNKVAHRGEPVFRDDVGNLHTVDLKLLSKWWGSVEKLFAWAV